jgi:hypothetical protein
LAPRSHVPQPRSPRPWRHGLSLYHPLPSIAYYHLLCPNWPISCNLHGDASSSSSIVIIMSLLTTSMELRPSILCGYVCTYTNDAYFSPFCGGILYSPSHLRKNECPGLYIAHYDGRGFGVVEGIQPHT